MRESDPPPSSFDSRADSSQRRVSSRFRRWSSHAPDAARLRYEEPRDTIPKNVTKKVATAPRPLPREGLRRQIASYRLTNPLHEAPVNKTIRLGRIGLLSLLFLAASVTLAGCGLFDPEVRARVERDRAAEAQRQQTLTPRQRCTEGADKDYYNCELRCLAGNITNVNASNYCIQGCKGMQVQSYQMCMVR